MNYGLGNYIEEACTWETSSTSLYASWGATTFAKVPNDVI